MARRRPCIECAKKLVAWKCLECGAEYCEECAEKYGECMDCQPPPLIPIN